MKDDNLPYLLLLALTLVTTGFAVIYPLLFEREYATVMRYVYPEVEQSVSEQDVVAGQMRIFPAGEQVQEGQVQTGPVQEPAQVTSVQFPLNINTATEEELKFVPGIGDVMSQRIVQYRDVLGGYTNLEQLMEIKGIAQATYEKLSPYLYVG